MKPEDFGDFEASIEVETLSGDMRDAMLTHVRSMKVPWAMLNEEEQAEKIDAIQRGCQDIVRRACAAISHRGFPHVTVAVGAIKIDKGLEIKLGAAGTVDNITRLANHGKASAILVLAESADFFGERGPAKPDADQPEMPFRDAAE